MGRSQENPDKHTSKKRHKQTDILKIGKSPDGIYLYPVIINKHQF